jgi:hypothetical protein
MGDSRFNQGFSTLVEQGRGYTFDPSLMRAAGLRRDPERPANFLIGGGNNMTDKTVQQQSLESKNRIIEGFRILCEEQRMVCEKLRLAYMNQCQELAERREFSKYSSREPWRYACWLMFKDLWPFSIWYRRHDR